MISRKAGVLAGGGRNWKRICRTSGQSGEKPLFSRRESMDRSAGEHAYRPGLSDAASGRFVMITGCSGAGKSSLLAELARRGYRTFPEPGRQIFKEQTLIGGPALPARDGVLFGELCISRTINRIDRKSVVEGKSVDLGG